MSKGCGYGDHGHEDHNHTHNHKSVIDGLADCQAVISGGMRMGAIHHLSSACMEIIITDEELSQEAVKKYTKGELRNQNKVCYVTCF